MLAVVITISVLFFLLILTVIGGFLCAIFMVLGGFQKQVNAVEEMIPLSGAPEELLREAFRNKSGDERFNAPFTLDIDRDVEGKE